MMAAVVQAATTLRGTSKVATPAVASDPLIVAGVPVAIDWLRQTPFATTACGGWLPTVAVAVTALTRAPAPYAPPVAPLVSSAFSVSPSENVTGKMPVGPVQLPASVP